MLLDIRNKMKKSVKICLILLFVLFVCALIFSNKKININELKTNMLQAKQIVIKKTIQNTNEYSIIAKETDNQKILNIVSLLNTIECNSTTMQKPAIDIQPKYLLLMYDSSNNEIVRFSINSQEIILVGECYLRINSADFSKLYSEIEEMAN